MSSPTVSMLSRGTDVLERECSSVEDHTRDLVVIPERHNRSARGAVTGMVLGAGLWGAILVLVGVIKI